MNTKTEKKFTIYLSKVINVFEWIGVICLIGITCIILLQIFLRNFLFIGLHWAEESARFLHISLIFLAVPVLQRERKLLSVNYVVQRLPSHIGNWIKNLSLSVCVLFSIFYIISFFLFMLTSWDVVTPDLRMPNIMFYSTSLLGFVFFIFVSVEQIIKELKNRSKM